MYVEKKDFKIVCDDRDYKFLAQADDDNRISAIKTAMEEAAGYLRSKYDIKEEYLKEGDERNLRLVMAICDISLWHLVANLSDYEGFEIRETRYNNTIAWLESVADGKITLDLPILTNEEGEDIGSSVQYGGFTQSKWNCF